MQEQPFQQQSLREQMMQDLVCSSCGHSLHLQARFCPHCGTTQQSSANAFAPHQVIYGVTYVSDVSHVSLLRKRLRRAAFSMKVIGFLSAIGVLIYGSEVVNFWVALAFGILVFCFAIWLSNRIRSGYTYAAIVIALWTVVWLAYDLFVALPPGLRDYSSGNSSAITSTSIGMAIFTLPIYFVIRGLLALRAYKSSLRSNPSKFFWPLTQNPWENGRKKTRKHPMFLNKLSVGMYVFLILAFIWIVIVIVSYYRAVPGTSDASGSADLAGFLIGKLLATLALLMFGVVLYRRARRHAMLPGSKLARKDNRAIVLYLRSFQDDKIKVRARATDGRIFLERFLKITFEELLTDHLWRYGPVEAIGDPRTKGKLAPLGAARDYESDATWQQKATDLMQQASIIVAVVGETNGFLWEIDTIVKLGFMSKLILVLPPAGTTNLTERWNNLVNTVTGLKLLQNVNLRNICAVVFPADQVVLITAKEQKDWAYETALDDAAALILDQGKEG